MKNRNLILWLIGGGFLMAIVFGAVSWRAAGKLQTENQALRAEIAQLNAAPRVAPPAPEPALAPEFETQKRELLRLRNEVAQLRSNQGAAKRAEEELARLRGQQSQAIAATPVGPAGGQSIPSADWKFLGYETPPASLISGLSAMKAGQLGNLLDTFTPEERQRFEAQMQGKSENEISQRYQKEFGPVTGLRVLAQHEVAAGEVVLDVYLEGIGKLKKYRMNQVNNEWKAGGPINQNFNPLETQSTGNAMGMSYYLQNPELMKRYFPQLYEQLQKQQPQAGDRPSPPEVPIRH